MISEFRRVDKRKELCSGIRNIILDCSLRSRNLCPQDENPQTELRLGRLQSVVRTGCSTILSAVQNAVRFLCPVISTAQANGLDAEKYMSELFSQPPGSMALPWKNQYASLTRRAFRRVFIFAAITGLFDTYNQSVFSNIQNNQIPISSLVQSYNLSFSQKTQNTHKPRNKAIFLNYSFTPCIFLMKKCKKPIYFLRILCYN